MVAKLCLSVANNFKIFSFKKPFIFFTSSSRKLNSVSQSSSSLSGIKVDIKLNSSFRSFSNASLISARNKVLLFCSLILFSLLGVNSIKLKKEDSSEWIADLTYNNGLAVISQYKIDSNGVVFAKENAIRNGKAQLKTILEERISSLIKDTSYYDENLSKTIVSNSEKYFVENNSWIDESDFIYVLVVISNENLERSIYESINKN